MKAKPPRWDIILYSLRKEKQSLSVQWNGEHIQQQSLLYVTNEYVICEIMLKNLPL